MQSSFQEGVNEASPNLSHSFLKAFMEALGNLIAQKGPDVNRLMSVSFIFIKRVFNCWVVLQDSHGHCAFLPCSTEHFKCVVIGLSVSVFSGHGTDESSFRRKPSGPARRFVHTRSMMVSLALCSFEGLPGF